MAGRSTGDQRRKQQRRPPKRKRRRSATTPRRNTACPAVSRLFPFVSVRYPCREAVIPVIQPYRPCPQHPGCDPTRRPDDRLLRTVPLFSYQCEIVACPHAPPHLIEQRAPVSAPPARRTTWLATTRAVVRWRRCVKPRRRSEAYAQVVLP